jgi:hypothetical protein
MPDPRSDRTTAHVRIPPPQSDEFRQRMRLVHDRFADSSSGSEIAARWARTLLVVALCIFALFTLFPFNFTLHTGQSFDWRPIDLGDPSDWVLNVLLTLPLGFALAAYATGRGWRGKVSVENVPPCRRRHLPLFDDRRMPAIVPAEPSFGAGGHSLQYHGRVRRLLLFPAIRPGVPARAESSGPRPAAARGRGASGRGAGRGDRAILCRAGLDASAAPTGDVEPRLPAAARQ